MATRRKGSGRPAEAGDGKTAIRVALISGAATLLAALTGGLFVLFSGTGDGTSASSNSSASPYVSIDSPRGSLIPAITSVSFAESQAKEIVIVKGVARDIPPGEALYAVASPQQTDAAPNVGAAAVQHSWFVGGPANIRHDGLWTVQIDIAPPTSRTLTVVAVLTATELPPTGGVSCQPCPTSSPSPIASEETLSPAQIRSSLRVSGPQDLSFVVATSNTAHAKPGH